MIIRKKLAALVKTKLATMDEHDVSRRDATQALLWLKGDVERVTVDFKIESRFSTRRGVFVWRLLHGVCGLSAANVLVEWFEPTAEERKASNDAARAYLEL